MRSPLGGGADRRDGEGPAERSGRAARRARPIRRRRCGRRGRRSRRGDGRSRRRQRRRGRSHDRRRRGLRRRNRTVGRDRRRLHLRRRRRHVRGRHHPGFGLCGGLRVLRAHRRHPMEWGDFRHQRRLGEPPNGLGDRHLRAPDAEPEHRLLSLRQLRLVVPENETRDPLEPLEHPISARRARAERRRGVHVEAPIELVERDEVRQVALVPVERVRNRGEPP